MKAGCSIWVMVVCLIFAQGALTTAAAQNTTGSPPTNTHMAGAEGAEGTYRPMQPTWLLGAGGAFTSSPYKKYDTWTPTPIIAYNGKYFYIRGTQGGVKFSPTKNITVGAFLEYDFTNFFAHNSDDEALEHLENRYGSLLAGLMGTVAMPFGGNLRASVATNVLATHGGVVGTLEYDYMLRYEKLMVTPFVGAKFFSSDYVDYYYGVSGSEAARTGLEKYSLNSMAVEPYVGLRLNYSFTENISATLGGSVRFLSPQVLDSPMVDAHKPVTYSIFGGILYGF